MAIDTLTDKDLDNLQNAWNTIQNKSKANIDADNATAKLADVSTPVKDNEEQQDESETNEEVSTPKKLIDKLQELRTSPTKNAPSVQETIAKLLGTQNKELEEAKQQRNQAQLFARLAEAGDTFGRALNPLVKEGVDTSFYQNLLKQANQPIEDIQTKQVLTQNALKQAMTQQQLTTEINQVDPNSAVSQAMRELYKKETGKEANPSLSYADISKMEPSLARLFTAEQNRLMRQSLVTDKSAEKDEKTQQEIQKRMNTLSQSSRSVIGKAAQAKVSVNRLLDIVNNPNSTNQDLQSAAADLNQVVSGTATMGGTEHQAYRTFNTDIAKALTYITNNPRAPDILKIKQHIADVANRMNNISDNIINQHIKSVTSGFSGWSSRHPREMQDIIQGSMPTSSIESNKKYDEDVMNYAKTHNISNEQAQQIKDSRTKRK